MDWEISQFVRVERWFSDMVREGLLIKNYKQLIHTECLPILYTVPLARFTRCIEDYTRVTGRSLHVCKW